MRQLSINAIIICVSLLSCSSPKTEGCDKLLDEVKASIKNYHTNSNDRVLYESISKIDKCEMNLSLAQAKAEIYTLLKECDEGLEFSSQLDVSIFKYPYQKTLFENLFNVCLDSANKLSHMREIQQQIELELMQNFKEVEIWYTLISIESQMFEKNELVKRIISVSDTLSDDKLKWSIQTHLEFYE